MPPSRQVAVIACMDARLKRVRHPRARRRGGARDQERRLGVVTEDEIRSLAISQRLLGTSEIILIHHTDCGMPDVHR